jgi:RNA polymerase sigma-70 factor (ECF subfamily)
MSRPATNSAVASPITEVEPIFVVEPGMMAAAQSSLSANGVLPESESAEQLLLRTFNEVRDELVSTLAYVLGNSEDAQDMAQEVFLRCWRTREDLPEIHNLRAWIFRVGINAAKDLQRSAWRRRVKPMLGADLMPALESPSATCDVEQRESLELLRQALAQLRPEEKEVFLLRQNGDLTYEEIAELSNRPVGTVKTQMRSALAKLRKVLA